MPTIWKSYASWAAADTLRTKPQFGAEGDILRKTRICPKEICAPRAAHTFFTGYGKPRYKLPVFIEIAMQFLSD